MVQAMEKASGREVRADLPPAGPWAQSSCPTLPHQAITATTALGPVAVGATGAAPLAPGPGGSLMVPLSLQIKYKIMGRREGDVASCYANPALAERELGWKAVFGLDKMCKSTPLPSLPCSAGCPSLVPLTALSPCGR